MPHSQLCVGDGEEFLKVLLAGKDTDRLYIAACDPRMQEKMFRDAFDAVGASWSAAPAGSCAPEGAIRFPDEATFSTFIKERIARQAVKR